MMKLCTFTATERCTGSMTTVSPLATTLSDHPFLAAIPVASLRRLATHAQSRTYNAGQEIFREGGKAERPNDVPDEGAECDV